MTFSAPTLIERQPVNKTIDLVMDDGTVLAGFPGESVKDIVRRTVTVRGRAASEIPMGMHVLDDASVRASFTVPPTRAFMNNVIISKVLFDGEHESEREGVIALLE